MRKLTRLHRRAIMLAVMAVMMAAMSMHIAGAVSVDDHKVPVSGENQHTRGGAQENGLPDQGRPIDSPSATNGDIGDDTEGQAVPQPNPNQDQLPDRVPEDMPPAAGEVPEDALSPIVGSVAEFTGADPKEIEVIRSQAVYWNDGSLGCPQLSMSYTQAPVDGYWVVLSYQGQEFDYRVSDKGFFSLCEGLTLPSTGFPSGGASDLITDQR